MATKPSGDAAWPWVLFQAMSEATAGLSLASKVLMTCGTGSPLTQGQKQEPHELPQLQQERDVTAERFL